ncbi:hypothetical protein DL93DRAFT_353314 [Clavulina sp. PMI_390]|nr:hypothetical protein DL93DRAFT_353314 [Clavulina sp. PMI_390]
MCISQSAPPSCCAMITVYHRVHLFCCVRGPIHKPKRYPRSMTVKTSLSLDSVPVELLLNIVGYLDVISIIRLSLASKRHYNTLGLSHSFWHRYSRLLLHDEQLPASCFDLDALNVPQLIQLATRSERIARAADPKYSQNLGTARRSQLHLDHEKAFHTKQSNIHQTPGGRWVLAIASRSQDDSLHIMCWDTTKADGDRLTSIFPTACAEIKPFAPKGTRMAYTLHPPTYDPDLQIYSYFVSGTDLFPGTSGSRQCVAIPIEMKAVDPIPPSFGFPDCTATWLQASRTEFKPSGRWVAIHNPGHEPKSIVWDSQTGQTSEYPFDPDNSDNQFDRIVVTHDGLVMRVQGGARARILVLHFSAPPASRALTLARSTTFEVPGDPLTGFTLASKSMAASDFITSQVFTSGKIRLNENSNATLVQIECYTAMDRFHTVVAVSADGTLHQIPDESWRYNEPLIPLWTSRPSTHFLLSTLANAPSIMALFASTSNMVTLDAGQLVLKCIPSTFPGLYSEKKVLLNVPALPFDDAGVTMDGACRGVCLRSGQWMFLRTGDGKRIVILVRCD